ncbi:unnamed protein product [Adineta ricciae]|uniref:Apple domain-containing protein n=1 Tax=Adineta ricciae TaxID=249248 RepID=A0A815CI37_ADIRI|nr:unnamed protein product [Adineta ricciae]CAF1362249.1 unnamed protein product [Adineta ricciae]
MKSLTVFLYYIWISNAFEPVLFGLSPYGNQFQPADSIELLAVFHNIPSVLRCTLICYKNIQCRTFDYDVNSQQCRLFEGSADTGALISSSTTTKVGWVVLNHLLYNFYNFTSDKCTNDRFLYSDNVSGLCQCIIHTFWNGSICVNQRYSNQGCINDNWCRTDLNLTCVSSICADAANSPTTQLLNTTQTSQLISTHTTQISETTNSYTTDNPECVFLSSTSNTLLYILNPNSSIYPIYTCYAYTWIATGPSATLSFFFRQDPGGWMIDDVTVYHNSTQLIVNGGFETGNLSSWSLTGTCNLNYGQVYYGSSYAKSGDWYYYDRCAGAGNGDTLSQTFNTVAGDTYYVSFWLTNYNCCDPTEIANITLM